MHGTTTIRLRCSQFPGSEWGGQGPVSVGIQERSAIVDAVSADVEYAEFQVPVRVKALDDGRADFGGPFVHGKPGDRWIYVVWFTDRAQRDVFRRAKIRLSHLRWHDVQAETVVARLRMTDARGAPIAATVASDLIMWELPA